MDLNSDNVEKIFISCLFDDDEDKTKAVIIEGITSKFGFNPDKLESHKEMIKEMLGLLPDSFKKDGGGGMSFLNACQDRNGNQWTDLHQRMEQLFVLGQAAGFVSCLLPRDMWAALPGGMPYYVVSC